MKLYVVDFRIRFFSTLAVITPGSYKLGGCVLGGSNLKLIPGKDFRRKQNIFQSDTPVILAIKLSNHLSYHYSKLHLLQLKRRTDRKVHI